MQYSVNEGETSVEVCVTLISPIESIGNVEIDLEVTSNGLMSNASKLLSYYFLTFFSITMSILMIYHTNLGIVFKTMTLLDTHMYRVRNLGNNCHTLMSLSTVLCWGAAGRFSILVCLSCATGPFISISGLD